MLQPDLLVDIPNQGASNLCSDLNDAALGGLISEFQCPLLQGVIGPCCEAPNGGTISPTTEVTDSSASEVPSDDSGVSSISVKSASCIVGVFLLATILSSVS